MPGYEKIDFNKVRVRVIVVIIIKQVAPGW